MTRRALTVRKARNKGWLTLGAAAASVGAFFISAWLAVPLLGVTGWLGYKWLKYRGEWGLRF